MLKRLPLSLRISLIVTAILIGLLLLLIAFLSPIARFLIQKYDQRFLGREVTLNWMVINPITGYLYVKDLKVFEAKSDSVFFSAKAIRMDLAITRLFQKELKVEDFNLEQPLVSIVQLDEHHFNFSDITERFAADDSTAGSNQESNFKFSLVNSVINRGEFRFREVKTPVNFSIKILRSSLSDPYGIIMPLPRIFLLFPE